MRLDWRRLYAANQAAIHDPRWAAPTALRGSPLTAVPRPKATEHSSPGFPDRRREARGGPIVYRPAGLDPNTPAPLIVALHGCNQSAASLARDTRLNVLADRHGLAVAYPEQMAGANLRRCWNWFEPAHQVRGRGEPAQLAKAVRSLTVGAEGQGIDRERVFLVGFSAGGAMACVLAATYPELFAGLAVHSGLAYRSAVGLPAALRAMRSGARDSAGLGRAARAAMGEQRRGVPAIVLHGEADDIVHPVNADQIATQWREVNGLVDQPEPTVAEHGCVGGGHAFARRRWCDGENRPVVEQIRVEGLAHAWAGGAPGAAYADARGPDATEAIWRFFTGATAPGRPRTRRAIPAGGPRTAH
jgi:poly(hydroxyalkanoate) depolymerase family esterase